MLDTKQYSNFKLIESSEINDLRKLGSHIIRRTYGERKKLKPDIKNIVFVEIRGTADKPTLVFLAEPTYEFKMKIVKFGKTYYGDNTKDNGYEILVQLTNFKKLREKYFNLRYLWQLDIKQFRELLDLIDVKIDCECMSFHWLGMRYRWSLEGIALYPTNIPDNVWKFRHNSRTICKHLKGTFQILRFHAPQILKKIKSKYSDKKRVILKPLRNKPLPMKKPSSFK